MSESSRGQKEFAARFCPHRGLGKDNTLEGIKAAIELKPYLVEFDIQLHDGALRLGHPPDLNPDQMLSDALILFDDTGVLPKVDVKITEDNYVSTLELLQNIFNNRSSKVLINIDGDCSSDVYMESEVILLDANNSNIFLNVDLGRYSEKNQEEIDAHIENLARTPFSVSPNIVNDLDETIKFAKKHKILHIHFWSTHNHLHKKADLYEKLDKVLDSRLEAYFDIKQSNIIE